MSADDVDVEPLHMWRVQDIELGERGAVTRYRCDLCLELLTVGPGQTHPEEC